MIISPRLRLFISSSILEVILVLLCIILAFTASGFLTADNLLNILRNISMQGVIAFGMTMVIISGEIDLSVGSAVAFAACLTAFLTQKLGGEWASLPISFAITVSIVVTLGIGFLFGAFTGFMRNRYQVPSFITTLALMTGLSGAAELITNGFPLTPFPAWYNFIGGGYVLGIPFPAILFLLTFAVLQFLMNYTSFGRSVYAVGGNAEAARLSGINVRRVKTMVFGITAFLAALSGVMVSSEIMSGTATTAKGWELDVIAAVIIGGTSFLGGVGRIWGTLIGVVFLGVMMNGMTLLNVSEYWQHVARGTIILVAVLLNLLQKEKGAR
ncbi:MAG: ABC transporter permease [Ignavibacteriales bacterium]|nr:ABC transporter permease [Ignavibacteriales bacterium]